MLQIDSKMFDQTPMFLGIMHKVGECEECGVVEEIHKSEYGKWLCFACYHRWDVP